MNKSVFFLILFFVTIGGVIVFLTQQNNKAVQSSSTTNLPQQTDSLFPNIQTTTTQTQPVKQQPQQPQNDQSSYTLATPTPTGQKAATVEQISTAVIKTTKGEIEFTLYSVEALNTVNNFVVKSKNGFYNNLTFHRVEDWVVQGGDPKGDGTGGGYIQTELNNKPFVIGSVGMARGDDIRISNDSQFFIVKKDSPALNAQYTNFGLVTKGIEVVDQIQKGDKILGITFK